MMAAAGAIGDGLGGRWNTVRWSHKSHRCNGAVPGRDPVVPNLRYGDVFDTLMVCASQSGPVIPNRFGRYLDP